MEEERAARLAKWQVAELIEDHEVGMRQTMRRVPRLAAGLLELQGVHELYGGEEAHAASMMLKGLHAEGRGQMRFAGARSADQHDVVCLLHELAAMELAHQGFVRNALAKVEACQVAVSGEARNLHLIRDGAHLALGEFGLH